jgi:hypothetical protein
VAQRFQRCDKRPIGSCHPERSEGSWFRQLDSAADLAFGWRSASSAARCPRFVSGHGFKPCRQRPRPERALAPEVPTAEYSNNLQSTLASNSRITATPPCHAERSRIVQRTILRSRSIPAPPSAKRSPRRFEWRNPRP